MDVCPLVLGTEPEGVEFWVIVFRRRDTHKATVAVRARTTTALTIPPAIIALLADELPETGVGEVIDGEGVEVRVTDGVEESRIEHCDEATRHERIISSAMFTAAVLCLGTNGYSLRLRSP